MLELLRQVRISDPERRVMAYPHQMSGGIRQRVAGAIAISCQPGLLIADEPTTSLDVTIQAQYLLLLKDLQRETNLALVFVTHDLGIVAKLCDRVAVMYAGRIVETGTDARDLRPSAPSLHRRPPELPADAPPRTRAADRHRGPAARSRPHAGGLRVRAALPDGRAALRGGAATARAVESDHLVACIRADETTTALAAPRLSVASAPPAAAEPAPPGPVLLEAHDLTSTFRRARGHLLPRGRTVKAVDGVSFVLRRGETLGLVGESGCGKTSTARLVLRLETPSSGGIRVRGKDVHALTGGDRGAYRRAVQAVFQDPYSSLNPRLPIRTTVGEPLHGDPARSPRKEIDERIAESLVRVGLRPRVVDDFPHELSGGQRQRVALARALTTSPECILLDEAVSALDVSIRAQIMNLLREIQERLAVSYLFIAHDLAVVKYISTRIGVMYLGKLVETATSEELYAHPLHPYTQILLSNALPAHPDDAREEVILKGEVPSAFEPPSGCRFHPRCPHVMPICSQVEPSLGEQASGHLVACHLHGP